MINQSTADNLRNLNTHSTKIPASVFEIVERAELARDVSTICRAHGIDHPKDIDAYTGLAAYLIEKGYTHDTALKSVRESVERAAPQFARAECFPSIDLAVTKRPPLIDVKPRRQPTRRRSAWADLGEFLSSMVAALFYSNRVRGHD